MPKTPPIPSSKNARVIDHVKTGNLAKEFREFKRINASELAKKLGFATPGSITRLEKGERQWSAELCVRYVKGISEILDGNKKVI